MGAFGAALEARKKQNDDFAHFPGLKKTIDSMPEEDRAEVIVALRGEGEDDRISGRELALILQGLGYQISASTINDYRKQWKRRSIDV